MSILSASSRNLLELSNNTNDEEDFGYKLIPVRNRKKYKRKVTASVIVRVMDGKDLPSPFDNPNQANNSNCDYMIRLEMKGTLIDMNLMTDSAMDATSTTSQGSENSTVTKPKPRTNPKWNEEYIWVISSPHEDGKDELSLTIIAIKGNEQKQMGKTILRLRSDWFDGYEDGMKRGWISVLDGNAAIRLLIEQKNLFEKPRDSLKDRKLKKHDGDSDDSDH